MNNGDPFGTVEPGDAFVPSAAQWNMLVRMARDFYRGGRQNGKPAPSPIEDGIEVIVKNNSGLTVPQFGVLAVTAPIILPSASLSTFNERHTYVGVVPDPVTAFVITQEPVANGSLCRAVIMGETAACLNVLDSTHQYAVPSTSTQLLDTAESGPARILWKDSTAGCGSGSGSGSGCGSGGNGCRARVLLLNDQGGAGEEISVVIGVCLQVVAGSGS
jgi:hypothetical protein